MYGKLVLIESDSVYTGKNKSSEEASAMNCRSCGTSLPTGAAICPKCGTVTSDYASGPMSAPYPPTAPANPYGAPQLMPPTAYGAPTCGAAPAQNPYSSPTL